MALSPPEAATPISPAASAGILLELAEIASNAANKQIDALVTRLADALLASSAGSHANAEETGRCVDAANFLKKNRYPFYYALSERLAAMLRHEAQLLADPATPAIAAVDALPPLPPDVEIDRKLCLIKASRAIESEHAGRVTALNIRLGHLLGRDMLPTAENPFRPQVFLAAIDQAWRTFAPDRSTHHLVFRLLGSELCVDVGSILHAQNTALIRRGILPVLAQRQDEGKQTTTPQAGAAQAGINDKLAQRLQHLFPSDAAHASRTGDRPLAGALPTLFADEQLGASVSREQLLDYLAQLQRSGPAAPQVNETGPTALLLHVRRWAPDGALAPADAHTLDLLIPVFELMLGNPAIATEIRSLIGTLQIPVLKAALLDREFFFEPNHPVRRVIDLLARLGAGWDRTGGPDDALYQTILRNVKRIQSDQRPPSFVAALNDIETFVAAEEAATDGMLADTISHALQQEKRLQAAKAAKYEVALRIGTGEVAAFVETFLEDRWVPVLTLAYTVKDEKPQVVQNAVRTMDDLCWSVKPKITMADRKELLAKLPGIVAMLNKWLDLIQWNDAERVTFFDELARCHASIVRAPLELSPERQVQIALAVAKKAAERRLRRQSRQPPEPAPDEFVHIVERLECGSWIEFAQSDKTLAKLRLAWISPMRNLFLFATRQRQEALSMTADQLAQALRTKQARLALAAGVVSHALEQVLASNQANGGQDQAA